jgi:hypothetical protein
VSPVKYDVGFYIPKDGTLHNRRRENLKSYMYRIVIVASWRTSKVLKPVVIIHIQGIQNYSLLVQTFR